MRDRLDHAPRAAPPRRGGIPRWTVLLAGLFVVAGSFAATLWALDRFWPADIADNTRPALVELTPLPPASRPSLVVAPIAISLGAIRTALDNAAPRDFSGKNSNLATKLLDRAELGVTVKRGIMAVAGEADALTITAPLTGTVHLTGQLGVEAGKAVGGIGGAIGNLLGDQIGQKIEQLASKGLDQRAEFRGTAVVTSRPQFTPAWRIEPNLTARVSITDTGVALAGVKLNLTNEIKPLLDPEIDKEIARLQARLRNDPAIERAARREWDRMCRSIPLGGGSTGVPQLWLELTPVKAFAAQPKIDRSALTLAIGVQSQTRIVPNETKPVCPFPAQLEIVAPMDNGRLSVGVPIDMPFPALNALLEAQLKGRHFPGNGSSPVEIEVRRASVAAAGGGRLLISLRVRARERKSWFGFGADATVHVWGRPTLDYDKQILRFADVSLAVESEAAFGLLGTAARAAMPYLQQAIASNAVIDLKPFAADAKAKIGTALTDFRQSGNGLQVDAAINELRLTGIEFDSHTLRVIAEAEGAVAVSINELPKL